MKAHILLVNRHLTYIHQPMIIQGINGEKIGVSQFDPSRSCHVFKMRLEDYEANATTILGTAHLAMQKWEPHFVVEPTPQAVRDFAEGYELHQDRVACPEGVSAYFKQGFAAANAAAYLESTANVAVEQAPQRTNSAVTQGDANKSPKYMPGVPDKSTSRTEDLPQMSCGLYAGMEKDASNEFGAKTPSKCEVVPEGVSKKGEDSTEGVPSLRGESGDAPRQLQQAPGGNMALPETSYGAPQGNTEPDLGQDLVKIPFFALQKKARAEGLDPTIFEDVAGMKAAIVKARREKLQPA